MKKHVRYYIAVLAMILLAPSMAWAQVPSYTESKPLVNEYLEDNDSPRKASWWNLLGRQLASTIDKPVMEVSVDELQNIIFFAAHHKEKVNLTDAVPSLLAVARNHRDEGYRIMAISALFEIGDRKSIREFPGLLENESSERVQKVIKAAYDKHYQL